MVNLIIDGQSVQVDEGTTVFEAAKKINIHIPSLCYMNMIDGKSVNCKGTCRICVVEVNNREKLQPSCSLVVKDGMIINTHTPKVLNSRKTILNLILSNHPNDCLNCDRSLNCELQTLARDFGVKGSEYKVEDKIKDISSPIIRDINKCILCRRCVTACSEVQSQFILTPIDRSYRTEITTFNQKGLMEANCKFCGQCVAVCPTGALTERMDIDKLVNILGNPEKYVVVQMAPAVRVALCEEFGVSENELSTKKIVAALKMLHFTKVFDTNFSADLTIMEETEELIERITEGKNLPMFTSCCPAWVRTMELDYPEYTNHLSSCKSPQEMFGAISKEYLPKVLKIDKESLVVVSIMPCIAKKFEAEREEMKGEVDVVLTTRELAKLIRETGIDILNIKEEDFDNPLGVASGAGMLFGASGGVMEAALRTAYEKLTGEELKDIVFEEIRGLKGIKEGKIKIKDKEYKIVAASSLKNAKQIMEDLKAGKCEYDFIEIMACPGGCINGGGQPYIQSSREKLMRRMEYVYEEDKNNTLRKCHENTEIQKVYRDFLGKPNSELAHSLLHTKYKK